MGNSIRACVCLVCMLVLRARTEEQGVLGCGIESWERARAALTEPSVSEEG